MKIINLFLTLSVFILFQFTVKAQTETPALITTISADVQETSGIIIHNNKLWTHNDSGGEAKLYNIDTVTGSVISFKLIRNADNYDWEDVCLDEDYLYIGDFGNNDGTREYLQIYKVLLSELDDEMTDTINSELITFTYDSSIYPEVTKSNNSDFDCEAMIAKDNSLYLFSKNWINKKCYLYSLPKIAGNYIAERLDTLNTTGLICGADYNSETNTICLIGYIYGVPAPSIFFLLSDFDGNDFFGGTTVRYELELNGYQTESAYFRDNTRVWITNENFLGHIQSLYEITLPTSGTTTSNSDFKLDIFPNPATDIINISLQNSEKFRYKITDTLGSVVIKSCKKQFLTDSLQIDISGLVSGKYFLELSGQNFTIKSSFIKI